MAYFDAFDDNGFKQNFYNVTKAVGNNSPNMTDDVLLVQFFLERFYSVFSGNGSPKGKMTVDGVFGPITRNWILKFQLDLRNQVSALPVHPDGIVDNAKTGSMRSSITRSVYTIIHLNGFLKCDPDWYNSLGTNPSVPPRLRPVFQQTPSQSVAAAA